MVERDKGDDGRETIEVECPECGAKVRLAVKDAEEKMAARCPKGHEIPLMRAMM